MHGLLRHILRHGHDVQTQLRLAAHGIHVAEGVGGGDLAEQVGVVGDGGEEVHRLYQGQLVANLIHGGVVALVEAHQQIGVVVHADALQQLRQYARAHLGAAAGALGQLCQLDVLFFHDLSPIAVHRSGAVWPPARRRPRPAPCPRQWCSIPVCTVGPRRRISSPGVPACRWAGCPAPRRRWCISWAGRSRSRRCHRAGPRRRCPVSG